MLARAGAVPTRTPAEAGSGLAEVELRIGGMDCPHCPANIEEALRQVEGVARAHVNHATSTAHVTYDASQAKVDDLIKAIRTAGYEPWRHRLLTTTITSEQARKFLLWGARGDVLCVRESVPGRGSQLRGWMTCAALASYLLGRPYWVWTPHGLYKLLPREPNVCRVDVSRLVRLNAAQLAKASEIIMGCDECMPGALKRRPGAPKPFCMNCGRDLVELPEVRDHLRLIAQLGPSSEDRAKAAHPAKGGVEHDCT